MNIMSNHRTIINTLTSRFFSIIAWSAIAGLTATTIASAASTQTQQKSSAPRASAKAPATTSTRTNQKQANAAAAASAQSVHKIWLSVDVVEQQTNPAPGKSAEKYRADVEISIADSATGKQVYARSGDMIQLMPRRTYFIMLTNIPAKNGVLPRVQGQRTQVIRTSIPKDDDVMYERKFVLNPAGGSPSRSDDGATSQKKQSFPNDDTTPNRANKNGNNTSKNGDDPFSDGINTMNDLPVPPNYYVIQYCALANESEALQIRASLLQRGVNDARVELYTNAIGQRYFRVRSGSYSVLQDAKAYTKNALWKSRKWMALHIKPIVVKSSV